MRQRTLIARVTTARRSISTKRTQVHSRFIKYSERVIITPVWLQRDS